MERCKGFCKMSDAHQQQEIDDLQITTKNLEIAVALAVSKIGNNDMLLDKVSAKLDALAETLRIMNENNVTKNNLEYAVNATLNKHAAKVFWSVLALSAGAAIAWVGSLMK